MVELHYSLDRSECCLFFPFWHRGPIDRVLPRFSMGCLTVLLVYSYYVLPVASVCIIVEEQHVFSSGDPR